jgi:hypothetical protein
MGIHMNERASELIDDELITYFLLFFSFHVRSCARAYLRVTVEVITTRERGKKNHTKLQQEAEAEKSKAKKNFIVLLCPPTPHIFPKST